MESLRPCVCGASGGPCPSCGRRTPRLVTFRLVRGIYSGVERPTKPEMTVATALRDLRERSASADDCVRVRELYDRFARDLYGVAYRLTGSRAEAEDVVHDVFVGLPEALHKFDGRGELGGWLRRVTARAALMQMRSRRRRGEVDLQESSPETASGTEATLARVDVARALASIPEKLRLVVVLKELEDWSHEEIARELGITVGTSKVRLHRARALLRDRLRSER